MRSIGVRFSSVLLVAFSLGVPPVAAQTAPRDSTPTIAVTGDIPQPLTLTTNALAAMPRATVTTTSNGIATVYEGVWLNVVLKAAGVAQGGALRGNTLASYVVASSSDGYRVLFSLGELDPELTAGQFLLADRANGQALFGENGAFRLVVPMDKRGARSIRMLSGLHIVQLGK